MSVLFRYDDVKPNKDAAAHQRQFITGLGWELSKKASLWADVQSQQPRDGSTASDMSTYFLHAILNF